MNHWFGAALPTAAQLAHWPDVPVAFVVMLVMVGIGEEAGWTAFAAPLLLRRNGLLAAWVVLSSVRILWHLPLMLNGEMPWVMGIVGNAAFQMIVLQLFVASGGHWSLAAVWHATLNAFGGMFLFTMVTRRGPRPAGAAAVRRLRRAGGRRRRPRPCAGGPCRSPTGPVTRWRHDRGHQHQSVRR